MEGVITEHQAELHGQSLEGMVIVSAIGASSLALDSFDTLTRFLLWLETQKIDGHPIQ